ncbi:MAG TPA: NACHT domain-containing protein [Sphingopyxis sp.]|uniref:NACHT domain-containing protein n=1 Tax=Sphingopyxis sp. TaxID=1908224 RepID=UPI002E32EFAF|nr:NACHT domain-containing protein [Sphingopyxis sp.]HEX2812321.1 NACHT domain-containing protein [Sphingopyxis sp.]
MDPITIGAAAIAAERTAKLFDKALERVEAKLSGAARTQALKALGKLSSYKPILEETYGRVSTFKTFADPANFVPVLDHFVSPTLSQEKHREKKISEQSIIEKISKGENFTISARAGTGKSMLARYISLSLFENPSGIIPLFIELRHMNRSKSPTLLDHVHKSYRRTSSIQIENLRSGLEAGSFCLILDGYDEINFENRESIEQQIIEISETYPKCSIIVTGRPNEDFQSWRHFQVWDIDPMSKSKVIELIKKLNYKRDVINRFIKKVNDGLFESHQSFLSNPLLAILMLLSYELNGNIPDKMHLFYSEAFRTLFHKHDATKDQYERRRRTSMQIDEFQEVFSLFCLKTYVMEKTEFIESELKSHLVDALKYYKKSDTANDLMYDLEEAVCLIMREGHSYFFVHRSFQEFFTAYFLSLCPQDIRDNFLNDVAVRRYDGVLSMLFEMARDQIEATWVIENCEKYLNEVGIGDSAKTHPVFAGYEALDLARLPEGHSRYSEKHFIEPVRFRRGKWQEFYSVFFSFYPVSENENSIEWFYELQRYAEQNWDSLPDLQSSEVSSWYEEKEIPVKSLIFRDIPIDELRNKLIYLNSERDFCRIKDIRMGISDEITSRKDFIDKLFSEN